MFLLSISLFMISAQSVVLLKNTESPEKNLLRQYPWINFPQN